MTLRPRTTARKHQERPHVLIVSDDPSLSSFLAEGLPLGGFWTTVIASGLQTLEVFRLRQFDLIALDWSLQSFDAHELLRRLRGASTRDRTATPRTPAPVVVFSEQPVELEDQLRALGVEAVLVAPLELDEVVRALHGVFDDWREDHPETPLADASSSLER